MNITVKISIILVSLIPFTNFCQEYHEDYKFSSYSYDKQYTYDLHKFKLDGEIKVKYFSRNSANRFFNWYENKKVYLLCSGAFSETWESSSKPVGLTVDFGTIINRNIDSTMDGLVLLNDGYLTAIDLDNLSHGIELDGKTFKLNPRYSNTDKTILIEAAENNYMTLFQTQLIYSKFSNSNFYDLYYGVSRERRFLAICSKNGNYYNIIINAPDELALNLSGKYAKAVLDYDGFNTYYILNLDTGGRDVFYYRTDRNKLSSKGNKKIGKSINLIVYYTE